MGRLRPYKLLSIQLSLWCIGFACVPGFYCRFLGWLLCWCIHLHLENPSVININMQEKLQTDPGTKDWNDNIRDTSLALHPAISYTAGNPFNRQHWYALAPCTASLALCQEIFRIQTYPPNLLALNLLHRLILPLIGEGCITNLPKRTGGGVRQFSTTLSQGEE